MGQSGRGGKVIDRNELDIRIADGGAKHIASDAAESVNSNFYCHDLACSYRLLDQDSSSPPGRDRILILFGEGLFPLLVVTLMLAPGLSGRNCIALTPCRRNSIKPLQPCPAMLRNSAPGRSFFVFSSFAARFRAVLQATYARSARMD